MEIAPRRVSLSSTKAAKNQPESPGTKGKKGVFVNRQPSQLGEIRVDIPIVRWYWMPAIGPEGHGSRIPRGRVTVTDETSVKVRIVTMAGVLVGKMSKPKNIRTLDALNLKGDFFALTEAVTEGTTGIQHGFIAINKRQIISIEELPT